ncbi:MAG: type III PLP-dependent enzyme [Candidatus Brocadiia bacterium]
MKKSSDGHKAKWQNNIKRLVAKHGSPLFIINRSKLAENLQRFRQMLPRVEPFYAVKSNPHIEILKVFARMGSNFDVASRGEMEALLKLGVKPNRMLFANTVKKPEVIKFAMSKGIRMMTFDSEYELNKMAETAPGAEVLARIKVPNVGSIVELSVKFGLEPPDAIPLLAKAHKLGLKPMGLSFHVGSQCTNVENYIEALELASIIMRDAKLKQLSLEVLDIGGGFPIMHFDNESDYFINTAKTINSEINRLFESNIRIISEPGRVLCGPACTLVMTVIGKSIRGNKHWYYLDDGVYGALSGIVFDHCKYQYQVMKKGPTQISTLAGPTCDGFDVISNTEELPELEIGDLVYIDNIGAYSTATATDFNNIPRAGAVTI